MNSFSNPFDAVTRHFRKHMGKIRVDSEAKKVTFGVSSGSVIYSCSVEISGDDSVLTVELSVPVMVNNVTMHEQIAELLSRTNEKTILGTFHYELPRGRITFRADHPIVTEHFDVLINFILYSAVYYSDRYFPAIMRVLYGGLTPDDAVFLSELGLEDEEDREPTQTECEQAATMIRNLLDDD